MTRKYPEKVTASMVRVIHNGEVLLMRYATEVHFGGSTDLLGIVVMTNPGKFELKRTHGWDNFKAGRGLVDILEGIDYPDMTMQNVIEVIRRSYQELGLLEPSGVLRIYNLSNIRQPNGQQAELYHERAKLAVPEALVSYLEDPVTHDREKFLDECHQAKFVIMGFVHETFEDKMRQVISWSKDIKGIVCAMDDKGRFSHPRRWRTEKELKEKAIVKLKTVLQKLGSHNNI